MKNQLEATKSRTRDLVAQTTTLQENGSTLERREQLVQAFLTKYQLTSEQIEALERKPIGVSFFEALNQAFEIHSECKTWLASSGGQQTTGNP